MAIDLLPYLPIIKASVGTTYMTVILARESPEWLLL
jgi:hypothetical protein